MLRRVLTFYSHQLPHRDILILRMHGTVFEHANILTADCHPLPSLDTIRPRDRDDLSRVMALDSALIWARGKSHVFLLPSHLEIFNLTKTRLPGNADIVLQSSYVPHRPFIKGKQSYTVLGLRVARGSALLTTLSHMSAPRLDERFFKLASCAAVAYLPPLLGLASIDDASAAPPQLL